MLSGPPGFCLHHSKHILQLIPEAHGAAALIISAPAEHPGHNGLIQQSPVHHGVHGCVRGVYLNAIEPPLPQRPDIIKGCVRVLIQALPYLVLAAFAQREHQPYLLPGGNVHLAAQGGRSAPAAIASQCIGIPAPAEYSLPVRAPFGFTIYECNVRRLIVVLIQQVPCAYAGFHRVCVYPMPPLNRPQRPLHSVHYTQLPP